MGLGGGVGGLRLGGLFLEFRQFPQEEGPGVGAFAELARNGIQGGGDVLALEVAAPAVGGLPDCFRKTGLRSQPGLTSISS